jgi:hypothetical protein
MEGDIIVILLKELIMEYNRVSLPCLGSFLSEYSPAIISKGAIYPPSKAIVFHQNEIWNDEKLEHRIATVNNVSIGMAKEELAFWIDNVCVLLATGEEVSLPGLGRMYVSKQAKLLFDQEPCNLLMESFGLEPVDMQIAELTENDLDELVDTALAVKQQEPKRSGTKGLFAGVIIITALALVSIFAIFRYILTDNKDYYPTPAIEIPVKTPVPELKYEEYFTSRYGIVLSVFAKLSDAREFSKNITGTTVYFIDNETPYAVILSYPTRESSDRAVDSLKTVYPHAFIIELSQSGK